MDHLIVVIFNLLQQDSKLAVAQAMFLNANRNRLSRHFPNIEWVWIDADSQKIKNRLIDREQRRNSTSSIEEVMQKVNYFYEMNSHFEPPDHPHVQILNTSKKELKSALQRRINAIFFRTSENESTGSWRERTRV